MEISDHDRAILAFERSAWRLGSGKDRQIRLQLGLTPARYHQCLDRVIDRAEALELDPMTVRRLRRLRATRRARRVIRSDAGLAASEERRRWG